MCFRRGLFNFPSSIFFLTCVFYLFLTFWFEKSLLIISVTFVFEWIFGQVEKNWDGFLWLDCFEDFTNKILFWKWELRGMHSCSCLEKKKSLKNRPWMDRILRDSNPLHLIEFVTIESIFQSHGIHLIVCLIQSIASF
jgi:hypothetical protein